MSNHISSVARQLSLVSDLSRVVEPHQSGLVKLDISSLS